jgi:hypothetical protein
MDYTNIFTANRKPVANFLTPLADKIIVRIEASNGGFIKF